MFVCTHAFAERPTRFLRIQKHNRWRFKVYSIAYGEAQFDSAGLETGLSAALRTLPAPAVTQQRSGVGFAILHQGRGADYVVLCWWDRENELPMHMSVRDRDDEGRAGPWRDARQGESICVWDMAVIWFERNAYVETVMAGGCAVDAVIAYLDRTIPSK